MGDKIAMNVMDFAEDLRLEAKVHEKESPTVDESTFDEESIVKYDEELGMYEVASCDKNLLQVVITTDHFGDETGWDLKNRKGEVLLKDFSLESNQMNSKAVCLPDGCFTFTIYDEFGDGICCEDGEGEYSVYYNNEWIKVGGKFGKQEKTEVGCSLQKSMEVKESATDVLEGWTESILSEEASDVYSPNDYEN